MTEEIKEILQEVNKIVDNTSYNEDITYFEVSHISKLLDYITNLQQENERLKEELKNRPIVDFTYDVYKELEDYKSRCENTDKIMYEFEEWLKSNFWNDDEGNESYQIEKYTTFYSVYRKLDLLKTLNKGDVNEANS